MNGDHENRWKSITHHDQMNLEIEPSRLRDVCHPFNFTDPPMDPIVLHNALTLKREENNGLGLAANQVGIPYKVISIKGLDSCLFNPTITYESEEKILLDEGCLSFPGLVLKVRRSAEIRVRYLDCFGKFHVQTFTGLTARVIQHEVDHLKGVIFKDLVSAVKLDMAEKKLRKQKK